MNLSWVVIGFFLLVYLGLLVLAIRRPLLARLALREAVRRPGQSAVVVLGLMVGTTAIFATQVLSDSFVQSSTSAAYLSWGRVDLVADDEGRFFDPTLASGLAADPRMQSSLAGVQAGVELPSSVVDLDRGNAKGMVTLIGFDPAAQGPFGSYPLSDGKTTLGQDLTSDQVLISASLAGALEARTGDRLRIAVGPDREVELRVAGIAKAEGPGAFTLRPALFSPLANLRPLIGDQGINVIRLSVPGAGRAELDRAHELAPQVRAALRTLPGGPSLNVREAKREDVDFLVKRASDDGVLFTGLSLFVALAGAALVVNLGFALAAERRPRHAVLRALGLSRAGMITLSVLEGALYSLAGAITALGPGDHRGGTGRWPNLRQVASDLDGSCPDGMGGGGRWKHHNFRVKGVSAARPLRPRRGLRAEPDGGFQPPSAGDPCGLAAGCDPGDPEAVTRLPHPAATQGRSGHCGVRSRPGLDDPHFSADSDIRRFGRLSTG